MNALVLLHITAALAWLALLTRLPALRRSPVASPARAHGVILLAVALALTLLLPETYSAISHKTGVANLALLLANGATAAACWAVQLYLLRVNVSGDTVRRGRRAHALFALVLGALANLFALAPLDVETRDFTGTYGSAPFVLEYRAVFLAYLGFSAGALARATWRWADRASAAPAGTGSPLPLGLRLVALGAGAGLVYVINELGRLIMPRLQIVYPLPAPNTVSRGLVVLAVTLMVLGSMLPAVGRWIEDGAITAWAARYRAYRRLYPLWLALYPAVPRIAPTVTTSPLAELGAIHDLRFRLHRRMVEIRDGIVALGPYLDDHIAVRAACLARKATLAPDEARIVVNAAVVAAAIRTYPTGRRAIRRTESPLTTGGEDFAGEIDYLTRLARAYRHSPIVTAAMLPVSADEVVHVDNPGPCDG